MTIDGIVWMARKNSIKKRKEYNDFLAQSEKEKEQERQKKLDKLREVRQLSRGGRDHPSEE